MELSTQNKHLIEISKKIFKPKTKKKSSAKITMPEETRKLLQKSHPPIYFAAIHRSLWETTASVVQINEHSTKTPYIIMGDNLPLKKLATKAGVIIYPRLKNKTIEESKKTITETKQLLKIHWEKNHDIIIFAGGGRAYDGIAKPFGKIGFEVAKEIAKRQEIYVIPLVVDYKSFRKRELKKFIDYHLGKKEEAQALNILDWINFTEKTNTTYTRLGEPIKITTNQHVAEITKKTFQNALDLTKILPENILALAKLKTYNSLIYKNTEYNIEKIIEKLNNHKELCELENQKELTKQYVLENSMAPFKYGTKKDHAWSQHFTNLVKHHYEKLKLI
ncbi:hypothetical protein K9L97_05820 [Candidatus Woesearchaeota archaeon]|nr:hypothetical protein [Candidatus Woesearchaeota archaeon]